MVSLENVEVMKSKKAKKRSAEEVVPDPLSESPLKKKKKKKKKTAENETKDATVTVTEENPANSEAESEEKLPFKKKFYSIHETTESRTKEEIKAFLDEHSIVLYGKGRKKFRPIFTFTELGFSDEIMSICSGFEKPTPIQVNFILRVNEVVCTYIYIPTLFDFNQLLPFILKIIVKRQKNIKQVK